MLTAAENELLTRIGPGTPMGMLFRRYWLPALLSEEIAEPDSAPRRFRLMGEDLLAFRDTSGAVGVLEERCPHRLASLALGRNEEGGLRCIYHGWKFNTAGTCLETPTEPAGSTFKDKVRARAYPVREAGGVVFAYLGPPEQEPPFPNFQWLTQPVEQSKEFKTLEECNYAQAVEGGLDEAHTPILHRQAPWHVLNDNTALYLRAQDLAPRFEIEPTAYGFRYAAIRTVPEGRQVRITPFLFPFWTVVAPSAFRVGNDRIVNAWVPRDDTSTWHFQWFFNTEQEVDVPWRVKIGGHYVDPGSSYRKRANKDNWYLQDRQAMKTRSVSGIDGIVNQDHAVNETQGPILDRTKEHLATSDLGVIAMRKALLDTARAFMEGKEPPGLDIPHGRITSETVVIQPGERWQDGDSGL